MSEICTSALNLNAPVVPASYPNRLARPHKLFDGKIIMASADIGWSDFLEDGTVLAVRNEWRCLICDVLVPCVESMKTHVSGMRHAENLAHYLAKGRDSWFGDPTSSRNRFWNAVREHIPDYPSIFDSKASFTSSTLQIGDQQASPTLSTGFPDIYRSLLPLGHYFCEVCVHHSMSRVGFTHHLSSFEHEESLRKFQSIEADYFQHVVDPSKNSVFYIGLVTKSVVSSISEECAKDKILTLQWRISQKHPGSHGTLMQANPEDMLSIFGRQKNKTSI